ncbi:hypothetical protein D9M68_659860 [compost metagenome]
MQKSDLFGYDAELWMEYGRTVEHGCELMLRFRGPLPAGHEDFWLPISLASGELAGWMRFGYVTSIRAETVFAGKEWRPATEPAPAAQDTLLLPPALT